MKTALITGISKGIGRALAEKFLLEKFAVIGTTTNGSADIMHEKLTVLQLDLTEPDSIGRASALVSQYAQTNGKIEILINNAGVLFDDEETRVIVAKLRNTLEVNLIGTVDFTERVVLSIGNPGHIVNISSQAGSLADIENFTHSHAPLRYPAYKISKAALNMYTRTLALRLKNENTGVTVSSVHPGWVKTDIGGEDAPVLPKEAAEQIYKLAMSKPETGQFWYNGEKFPW